MQTVTDPRRDTRGQQPSKVLNNITVGPYTFKSYNFIPNVVFN